MKRNILKNFAAAAHTALLGVTLGVGLTAMPATTHAQTATINGVLSGVEINNDTGQVAHGFEVQFEGADESDLFVPGFGERYGLATIVPYATGIYVRWISAYDPVSGTYVKRTLPAQALPPLLGMTANCGAALIRTPAVIISAKGCVTAWLARRSKLPHAGWLSTRRFQGR